MANNPIERVREDILAMGGPFKVENDDISHLAAQHGVTVLSVKHLICGLKQRYKEALRLNEEMLSNLPEEKITELHHLRMRMMLGTYNNIDAIRASRLEGKKHPFKVLIRGLERCRSDCASGNVWEVEIGYAYEDDSDHTIWFKLSDLMALAVHSKI